MRLYTIIFYYCLHENLMNQFFKCMFFITSIATFICVCTWKVGCISKKEEREMDIERCLLQSRSFLKNYFNIFFLLELLFKKQMKICHLVWRTHVNFFSSNWHCRQDLPSPQKCLVLIWIELLIKLWTYRNRNRLDLSL